MSLHPNAIEDENWINLWPTNAYSASYTFPETENKLVLKLYMDSCAHCSCNQCNIQITFHFSAITFVALGTSLPDTFASKTAAVQEKYADNAVGNVTGSNSVNVFLGLGLPWFIAAVVHLARVCTALC